MIIMTARIIKIFLFNSICQINPISIYSACFVLKMNGPQRQSIACLVIVVKADTNNLYCSLATVLEIHVLGRL